MNKFSELCAERFGKLICLELLRSSTGKIRFSFRAVRVEIILYFDIGERHAVANWLSQDGGLRSSPRERRESSLTVKGRGGEVGGFKAIEFAAGDLAG